MKYKYPDQAKREVLNAIQQFTDLRPCLNTHGECILYIIINLLSVNYIVTCDDIRFGDFSLFT